MSEDVVLEAGEVEAGARRQEIERRLGQVRAPFAFEHGVEALFQFVQVQHVRGRVGLLLLAEPRRRPVGTLLLLREFDAEQFRGDVLEPVPVGLRPRKLRGDLRAVDRLGIDT